MESIPIVIVIRLWFGNVLAAQARNHEPRLLPGCVDARIAITARDEFLWAQRII
jgi:hypothetical protein